MAILSACCAAASVLAVIPGAEDATAAVDLVLVVAATAFLLLTAVEYKLKRRQE